MKLYGQYGRRYYVCNMLNFNKNFNTQFLNALGLVILLCIMYILQTSIQRLIFEVRA